MAPVSGRMARLLIGAIACLASMMPLAVLSKPHAGTWLGTTDTKGFIPEKPLFALPANLVILLLSNLLPPF